MSQQNDSFASNSRAASVAFRQNDLKRAGILFPPDALDLPADIERLKASIISYPASFRLAESDKDIIEAIKTTPLPDRTLFEQVYEYADVIHADQILSCALQHERVWMREINEPTLSIYFKARREGIVSTTEDFIWKEGKELASLTSSVTLSDPKPDVAIGLKPAKNDADSSAERLSITMDTLEMLRESTRVGLIYSPSHRRDIVYPAIIYEAKSDSNPILWAENQVAIGASRALGLLADLSRSSNWATVPPVFALTSAGSLWQVHIAFIANNGNVVSSSAGQP